MSGRPARDRQCLHDESGISLLEVVLAIFMLSVALMAIASVATTSLASVAQTRDREQATNVASAAIEDVRSRDFSDVAHLAGEVDLDRLPAGLRPAVAAAGCFSMDDAAGEPVFEDVVDEPVVFEDVAGDRDDFTIHTIITAEGVDCATVDPPPTPLKRVTAIASWGSGGVNEFVLQQTLVTDVGRGLPVPRFEIRPEEATVRFSEAFLTDPDLTDLRKCAEHNLRNLGAEDSYDWELTETSGAHLVSPEPVHDAYDAAGWRVTAFLEFEPADAPREGAPPPTADGRFASQPGFPRLVSDLRVESASSALLTVCSEPNSTVDPDALPEPVTMLLTVRSRFDERQERSVLHQIAVGPEDEGLDAIPGRPLYLFEDPDDEAHARDLARNGIMGPLAPDDADPNVINRLSTHGYTPDVANWSTDVVSSENLSGVRLVQTASPGTDPGLSAHTATWHYQFNGSTAVERTAHVVLWVAPPEALQSTTTALAVPIRLQIRLDELRNNETPSGWAAPMVDHVYTHMTPSSSTTGGWERIVVPVDLGGIHTFNNNRYLRLRTTCVAPVGDGVVPRDCNLAYDNESFRSAVYIEER